MAFQNDVTMLMIGGASVWQAPLGTALPAKTVLAGEAWGVGWQNLGITGAPLAFADSGDVAVADHIEQALGIVDRALSSELVRVETTLAGVASPDVWNLARGGNGTITEGVANSTTGGFKELTAGGKRCLNKFMIGFEGIRCNETTGAELPTRLIIFRATATPDVKFEIGKGEFSKGIPIAFESLEDLTRPRGARQYALYTMTSLPTP